MEYVLQCTKSVYSVVASYFERYQNRMLGQFCVPYVSEPKEKIPLLI